MYLESSDSRSERQAAYSGVVKILVRSRGFASSLPRVHLHQRRRCAGDERRVAGGGDLGHLGQQFDVGRALVEVVVAHQATEGLAAELAEFLE